MNESITALRAYALDLEWRISVAMDGAEQSLSTNERASYERLAEHWINALDGARSALRIMGGDAR